MGAILPPLVWRTYACGKIKSWSLKTLCSWESAGRLAFPGLSKRRKGSEAGSGIRRMDSSRRPSRDIDGSFIEKRRMSSGRIRQETLGIVSGPREGIGPANILKFLKAFPESSPHEPILNHPSAEPLLLEAGRNRRANRTTAFTPEGPEPKPVSALDLRTEGRFEGVFILVRAPLQRINSAQLLRLPLLPRGPYLLRCPATNPRGGRPSFTPPLLWSAVAEPVRFSAKRVDRQIRILVGIWPSELAGQKRRSSP